MLDGMPSLLPRFLKITVCHAQSVVGRHRAICLCLPLGNDAKSRLFGPICGSSGSTLQHRINMQHEG